MKLLLAFGAAFLALAPAHAATFVDDFNRPNGPGLGPDYTIESAGFQILDNQAITTSLVSLAILNNSSSNSASIDVALRGSDGGSYVGLAFGYASNPDESFFIKVQDNNSDGFFDSYGFFTGNNGFLNGLGSLSPFRSGTITASYVGSMATLVVTSGASTQTFMYDYMFAPDSNDVGFGLNRLGVADNFTTQVVNNSPAVPEPGTWAMMIGGFGLLGATLRARRSGRRRAPAA